MIAWIVLIVSLWGLVAGLKSVIRGIADLADVISMLICFFCAAVSSYFIFV